MAYSTIAKVIDERARELMANKYSLQASVDKLARVLEKALYR